MIIRRPSSLSLLLTLLLASVWASYAKKDSPRITSTEFENAISNLFYFDDSDVILAQDREAGDVWRSDDAGETWAVINDDEQTGSVWDVWPHPTNNQRAYILGLSHTHWVTEDQGKTWRRFETDATPSLLRIPFSFHARDPDKVILHGSECLGWDCSEETYYTTDGFKTVEHLRTETRGCYWAVSQPEFGVGTDEFETMDDRILCVVRGLYSPWTTDNRLLISDDFFESETEPSLDAGRTVTGIISAAAVKKYFVAAARAEGSDELALYVTDDASTWHRAEFGNHKLEEDAYTILESTNYSIQVDVMTTKPTSAMGVLFTSNSNGTYFTRNVEHTNRDMSGLVDFEKISGIQGIVLVNVVENWEEIENTFLGEKNIQSRISFDDGRTWQDLTADGKRLHLHSVTDLANSGRVFSSPAPGIVMGVGNTGKKLKDYEDGDLYVSDDAGLTWRLGLDGAHKYEFGDQGAVIMAVDDEGTASEIKYSLNHGKDWETTELDAKVRPRILTTTPDSTSLKFLLLGTQGKGEKAKDVIFSIDFEGLHERKCGNKDFEDWAARLDENGKPDCLMGHKQFYRRRKADADCFIDDEFKDPMPSFESCKCTKEDFECDFNFVRSADREECLPAGPLASPEGTCEDAEGTFKGSSGWRLIPGNDCNGGETLDKEIERPCKDTMKTPPTGEVGVEKTSFDARMFSEYYYLEKSATSSGDDETIVMRTSEQEIYITRDHGKTWKRILEYEPITAIYPHQYNNDVIFFLTDGKEAWYSIDRGERMHAFKTPDARNEDRLNPLAFHPDYKDWLIWTGASDCPGPDCHSVAHYTTDRGDTWETLLRYVRRCEYIKKEGRGDAEKLVYCEQFEGENPANTLQLLSSDNWFADSELHFKDIVDFATMSEFIIVAARASDQKSLKVDASVDGKTFADAEFPKNFDVPVQQAYTVLDSSTHAVFLHVTVNNRDDHEHGMLIKSNSNGTSYVLSMLAVNRDTAGYVDFEKMQGLEGVALINVVVNWEDTDDGQRKKLESRITHNDGAEWSLLAPPERDNQGKKMECSGKNGRGTDQCALHIHSYTEREDKKDTFGSQSAIGLMMAVGNVGDELKRKDDDSTHTFITRDGGISWDEVMKGSFMWEYGDQGSIIVIVEESKSTDVIYYTLDEGKTWTKYKFTDIEMQIDDISTVPSDTSRQFLLWGKEVGRGASSDIFTVNLDFSGLKERQRQCELDETGENDDYYLWEPKHPLQNDNCLFGHVAQYHRKRLEADCYNGRKIDHLHNIAKNCSCTRQDFEW